MSTDSKRRLQPPGWAEPRGYANGVSAAGTQVFVAGQIGWNAQSWPCWRRPVRSRVTSCA
jgi:enamine deaminase RidA (YjgF/YER057c/UK114 family)